MNSIYSKLWSNLNLLAGGSPTDYKIHTLDDKELHFALEELASQAIIILQPA